MNFLKEIWLWLGDSKEQIVSISAVIGVFIAVSGLRTWQKELKGKSEYQKAKEVLKAVYRVRQAFAWNRTPWINSWEYPADMCDEKGQLKAEFDYQGTAHAYTNRKKQLDDAMAELQDQTLEAQVEWGAEFQDVLQPIAMCYAQLFINIQVFINSKKDGPHSRLAQEQIEERNAIIYAHGDNGKNDAFTSKIDAAVSAYESKLRPRITCRSYVSGFWPLRRH